MTISFRLTADDSQNRWRSCDKNCRRTRAFASLFAFCKCLALVLCCLSLAAAQERPDNSRLAAEKPAPPSPELERIVADAFAMSHDGWSTDEVLLDDGRREKFVSQCRKLAGERGGPNFDPDACCRALLHLRKAGGKLPRATKRAKSNSADWAGATEDELLAASEIAARQLGDQKHCHTDAILVDTEAREFFDRCATKISSASTYALRKAALRLRKTRRLEPELLARVTDWKLQVVEHSVRGLQNNLAQVPARPGIYLFRDKSGYLYIGQASDLRKRLTSHLTDSDRRALSDYLNGKDASQITVEIHVFLKGSPGEQLRTRRAYESEMIRTRSPRLNLAP